MATTEKRSICGFLQMNCSHFVPCGTSNNNCHDADHVCIHHPECSHHPVCYPLSMTNQSICPSIISKSIKKKERRWVVH
jgi:hypothetical protein